MSMRLMRFKDGKERALTLSYDDGVYQDERLVGILNKYGIKSTFNISSNIIGTQHGGGHRVLNSEEMKKVYSSGGHEVAIHGHNHPYFDLLPSQHCTFEIIENRRILEDIFERNIRGGAYPFGTYNDEVVDILGKCGIRYCRTTKSTHSFEVPCDWLRMPATCHHNDERLFELLEDFLTRKAIRRPLLFYLWGHSYEFDNNNNWKIIEEFCEKAGGHDDVWYATNIEIYDYVNAYNSLEVSADGTRIYNPTLIDVWMYDNSVGEKREGKVYCIKSGETIIIKD